MSSNTAKVINEPQPIKWHCRERINAEIDDECLILLGKVFHAVITLGTKDEHIYWVQAKGLTNFAWQWVLEGKSCRTKIVGGK